MEANLGFSQVQGVSHQLNLAPQLFQWLKILQVPAQELSQMIQHEIETNPALEVQIDPPELSQSSPSEDETSIPADEAPVPTTFDSEEMGKRLDALKDLGDEWKEDFRDASTCCASSSGDDQSKHQFLMDSIASKPSLCEHLGAQASVLDLTKHQQRIAEAIIGSLDNRGYLSCSVEEIAAIAECKSAEAEDMLRKIQAMDTPGIAARDLRECLILQVNPASQPLAHAILNRCFDLLSQRRIADIGETLDVEEDDVNDAIEFISKLSPTPGTSVVCDPAHVVIPDITVTKTASGYDVELNHEYIPRLRLSGYCRKLIADPASIKPEDLAYLRRKMRNASFLIQGISQRQETLKRVAKEIVRVHKEFFDSRNGEIGSLTMSRIARVIGVHETTVSRAIAGKYMDTPRGVFELKFFCRAGYSCTDGSALTADQVRHSVGEIVEREHSREPLTDIQIAALLKQRGLKVARRTVAKYREELHILSSKERFAMRRKATQLDPIRVNTAIPAAMSA